MWVTMMLLFGCCRCVWQQCGRCVWQHQCVVAIEMISSSVSCCCHGDGQQQCIVAMEMLVIAMACAVGGGHGKNMAWQKKWHGCVCCHHGTCENIRMMSASWVCIMGTHSTPRICITSVSLFWNMCLYSYMDIKT
jgi:hypothetical protein